MTLSEAIRLGAMLKPQARNGWDNGKTSCALMAAADAAGIPSVDTSAQRLCMNYAAVRARFPILNRTIAMVRNYRHDLCELIYILNDSKGWSRERIADYVERIERADGQTSDGGVDRTSDGAATRTLHSSLTASGSGEA